MFHLLFLVQRTAISILDYFMMMNVVLLNIYFFTSYHIFIMCVTTGSLVSFRIFLQSEFMFKER